MKRVIGPIICSLLVGCEGVGTKRVVVAEPSPGIEYHNQDVAPWPWVSVVPTQRALILKSINFDAFAQLLRFDMSFEAFSAPFQDVCLVVLDYTILPKRVKGDTGLEREPRYFMTAS